jgi:hypothetical protein
MVKVIIINKNGTIKESNVNFDIEKVYKYAGLKKVADFGKIYTWKNESNYVTLFANRNGKAGSENKYEIPPPKDNDLFFGNIVLVQHPEEDLKKGTIDLTLDLWEKCYNCLYGGFDELVSEEDFSEDDIPEDMKTSGGYMKNSFVVDDDEPIEYGEEEEEEEEEECSDRTTTDEDEMSELSEEEYSDTEDDEDDEDEEEDEEEEKEEDEEDEEEEDEEEDEEDEEEEDEEEDEEDEEDDDEEEDEEEEEEEEDEEEDDDDEEEDDESGNDE